MSSLTTPNGFVSFSERRHFRIPFNRKETRSMTITVEVKVGHAITEIGDEMMKNLQDYLTHILGEHDCPAVEVMNRRVRERHETFACDGVMHREISESFELARVSGHDPLGER